jgi:hypothetical protein
VWLVLVKWFCGDGMESCTVRGCVVGTGQMVLW